VAGRAAYPRFAARLEDADLALADSRAIGLGLVAGGVAAIGVGVGIGCLSRHRGGEEAGGEADDYDLTHGDLSFKKLT
jgi:hypothetical protein